MTRVGIYYARFLPSDDLADGGDLTDRAILLFYYAALHI